MFTSTSLTILMNCIMNFWWLVMNVSTKLSSSWWSRENSEIHGDSSDSWIMQILQCLRKIYSCSYYNKQLALSAWLLVSMCKMTTFCLLDNMSGSDHSVLYCILVSVPCDIWYQRHYDQCRALFICHMMLNCAQVKLRLVDRTCCCCCFITEYYVPGI